METGHTPDSTATKEAERKIIKRNGDIVPFDKEKIVAAISKAFAEVHRDTPIDMLLINRVADIACNRLLRTKKEEFPIVDVQNAVEQSLINASEFDVARAYTEYRLNHDIKRRQATSVEYQIQRLFDKADDVVNENANKDADVYATQRDLTAGVVDKALGLKMLPRDIADAHMNGLIHWHDLDYSPATTMHNCALVDLKGMLEGGFRLGNADVESPKSLTTAVAQAAQILSAISSNQYGGTSYDRVDEVLAPYAKKSYDKYLEDAKSFNVPDVEEYAKKMTIKEIQAGMQSLEYEVNTLTTVNGQVPFSTLGFGLGTDWFAREIQKAILNQRIAGLGKDGRTAIFPKLLFTIKPGLNMHPDDPNYDIKQLALKSVVRRMSPEILNYDNIVDITGSFKSSMGCRSFLGALDEDDLKALGENEDFSSGRVNLGVVSLNLPRIALDSHGDKDTFWKLLDERLELVKRALLFRIDTVKSALPKANPTGYMFGGFGRLGAYDDIDELFHHNRASVSLGYVGLYEMAAAFYGDWQHDHDYDQEAHDFAYDVLKHLNKTAKAWKDEYHYGFSVYGTPGESLNSRFEEIDHKLYPNVKHVTDHDFYTNSFHYFVERKPTPFEKMAFEAPFQHLSTGGFISYVELPVMKDNLEAVEAIWDYSYECGIGYMEINTAIDHCLECGFKGEYAGDEKGYHCPNCGNSDPETSDVTRRTCFTKDTLVETSDGYKAIQDVTTRDQVRTASGEMKRVVDTMEHLSDNLIVLKLSGGEDITSTADHPYFAKLSQDDDYAIHRADELTTKSYVGIHINTNSRPITIEGLPTDNPEFWWLVGRIVGDGFVVSDRGRLRTYITVGKQDEPGIAHIQQCIDTLDLGFVPLTNNRTVLRSNTYNRAFGQLMSQVGHGAANKQIPTRWLDLPVDLAEALLDGYLSADGCVAQNNQICNSTSRELLYGIGQLVLKTKHVPYRIYKNRDAGEMIIEGRVVQTQARYDLKYTMGTPRFNYIEDGIAYIRVMGVESSTEPARVYNLTVEDEHTYTVNNISVHNCGYLGNPMKRPMKRGRQAEIIHRVKHVSGGLGQLSDGNEIWSDDEDEKKVR